MEIVATTSLPAVDRPNADRWNAARSCQYLTLGPCLSIYRGLQDSVGVSYWTISIPSLILYDRFGIHRNMQVYTEDNLKLSFLMNSDLCWN